MSHIKWLIIFTTTFFSAQLFALSDVRLDDVYIYQTSSQSFSELSRLYIKNGKIEQIESIEKNAKPAKKIMSGAKNYVIPGFIDLHVHLGASGSEYGTNYQQLSITQNLNASLYLGVTSVVDLFSSQYIQSQVSSLNSIHTNVYFAGALFTNKGGHGSQFRASAYEISQDSDIEKYWQQHLASNPQVTKAVIESFGGTGSTLTDPQLTEIGQRSHAAGLPYFVHVSTLHDAKRAIKVGADVLAHGVNSQAIDQEFIDLMKRNNVTYVPTLSVYHNHAKEHEFQFMSKQKHLLSIVHPKLSACLFEHIQPPVGWMKKAYQAKDIAADNIMKLKAAGIKIGAGSDAGNPYVMHGLGLHHELQALKEAGLSNADVIDSATVVAQIALGQPKTGEISVGFDADMVVMAQNPLNNLNALSQIKQVIKKGVVVNRKRLLQNNLAQAPLGRDCSKPLVGLSVNHPVIDDFYVDNQWQVMTDTIQQGNSQANTYIENKQRVIEVTLGQGATWGNWAGAQLVFTEQANLSHWQGIEVTFTASQGPLFMALYDARVQDWDHFQTMLMATGQQQKIKIPFTQLKQFGFGKPFSWQGKSISGVNFLWRSQANAVVQPTKKISISKLVYY